MPALGMDKIADAAYKAGFTTPAQLSTMIAIAMGESGGDPSAVNYDNPNPTVDYGLFQINSVHKPDLDQIYDPYYNAQQAWKVYDELGQGFGAWVVYDRGLHTQYMPEATRAAKKYLADRGFAGQAVAQGRAEGEYQGGGIVSAQAALQQANVRPGEKIMAALARAVSNSAKARRGTDDDDVDVQDESALGDSYEMDELASFLQQRRPIAQVGELPAEEPADDDVTFFDEFDEIPEVSKAAVASWLEKGLQQNAAQGAAVARALGFDGVVHGVGSRSSGTSDHPHGNAIDLMTNDDLDFGQQLADFFLANREALGVKYVIFNQRIASAKNGWEWRGMEDRGNPTQNHVDHPHVSFY